MDDELYQALLKADRSESLAPLAEGLGRELNEDLAKILAAVSLVRHGGPVEALDSAEAGVLAARERVRRILALGRGDGSERQSEIIARELLEEAARSAGAGIAAEISVTVAEGTHPIRGERGPLVQAFQNLVRNSVESMNPTPPRPRIQLSAADATLAENEIAGLPAGDYVEFEVRDNGCGIPPDDLEKIWDPFFTTRKHATGLGLPTVLAVVRRLGGQVGVDSDVGAGSVFTLFLPRSRPAHYSGAQASGSSRYRTGRILVVDHDEALRNLAAGLLDQLAYKCDLARDGEDAIAQYRRYWDVGRPHDAVILDLRVPGGMPAEETLARLKEFDPDVRSIACGPGTEDELRTRCAAGGFSGWLAKPYRRSELGEVLQTLTA